MFSFSFFHECSHVDLVVNICRNLNIWILRKEVSKKIDNDECKIRKGRLAFIEILVERYFSSYLNCQLI